jgi:hypothetical protein
MKEPNWRCAAMQTPFPPPRWPGGAERVATCTDRISGRAPQFGALHWRRSAAGSTLLATIATAWQWLRRFRRRRASGAAANRVAFSAAARRVAVQNMTVSNAADYDGRGVAIAPFPPPRGDTRRASSGHVCELRPAARRRRSARCFGAGPRRDRRR